MRTHARLDEGRCARVFILAAAKREWERVYGCERGMAAREP